MKRNVVLVTIDSLRADFCGYLNSERHESDRDVTPTLDAMAADGLAFETAISPGPSTYESMPAIFTGELMTSYDDLSAEEVDADPRGERGVQIERNMRRETIPEWFASHGYDTAGFSPNPYTGAYTSFARGFKRYEDFLDEKDDRLRQQFIDLPLPSEVKNIVTLFRRNRATKPWHSYYDQISDWIETCTEPYFLWIFLLDPHTPYLVKSQYRDKTSLAGMYYQNWKLWASKKWDINIDPDRDGLTDLYQSAIRAADDFLARLSAELSGTDPVFVVHSDHGEAFGEHDIYGHHSYLYEENIHVPLVLSNTSTTGRISKPVSLGMLPGLLRAAATDSVDSVTSSLETRTEPYVCSRTHGPQRIALRGENCKYIGTIDQQNEAIIDDELYSLSADPIESVDIAEQHPTIVESCHNVIQHRLTHEQERETIHQSVDDWKTTKN